MSGHRGWSDVRGAVSPEEREEIDQIKRVMVALERLHEVRLESGVSEAELAHALEASQRPASREPGEDLYLSTLRRYVEALGGRLELRAVFEDDTVSLA